jgi:biopolymer transport protein ExbD
MPVKIDKGAVSGGINVIPMIDCVLFLLIFFLITSRFEESERELPVVLPQASEAMPLTARPKQLFVNVDQQGHFIVSRQRLNEAQLLAALVQAAANNPGRQSVIIRADERCEWKYVMAVMNSCNKAKIRDYQVTALKPGTNVSER